jgi:metal-responsive CopG/Arc/MetJ family transcriptional regulator
MKTAISIPDDLFEAAERLAEAAGKSRSALYAEALREYLSRHLGDEVTDAMNRVVDDLGQPDRRFGEAAARRVLESTEW